MANWPRIIILLLLYSTAGQRESDINLVSQIDLNKSAALNNDTHTYIKTILNGSASGLLTSDRDVDEQLILVIQFVESVKIKQLIIYANHELTNDRQSAAATIKLFVNSPNMDFNDCESNQATQSFTLDSAQLNTGQVCALKLVKFNNVQSITMYIPNNMNSTPVTYINRLDFIGSPIAGFNVAAIKKVGGED